MAPATPLPTLLLIDDDLISREVIALTFEMCGYSIYTADSGEEALSLLAGTPADFILMDTQMPGISGPALLAALRAASHARIVAISGSPVPPSLAQLTDGVLLKPVTPESFEALLADTPSHPSLAPVPATTGVPLIDPDTRAKLQRMMKPKALRQIYQAVADDLGPRLTSLAVAVHANNPSQVHGIAHSIKGGCAMVGLTRTSNSAANIETSDTYETWPAELANLEADLHELNSILIIDFPE